MIGVQRKGRERKENRKSARKNSKIARILLLCVFATAGVPNLVVAAYTPLSIVVDRRHPYRS